MSYLFQAHFVMSQNAKQIAVFTKLDHQFRVTHIADATEHIEEVCVVAQIFHETHLVEKFRSEVREIAY